MRKIIGLAFIAATLAGCASTGKPIHVATGVDANGAVIWETMYQRPTIMNTPTESLSDGPCWNKECN